MATIDSEISDQKDTTPETTSSLKDTTYSDEHGATEIIDEAAEQKVIRKLDRWIVPPGT